MRRRVMLLWKPLDCYLPLRATHNKDPFPIDNPKDKMSGMIRLSGSSVGGLYHLRPGRFADDGFTAFTASSEIVRYLDDRCRVHKETIKLCQEVLQRKFIDWEPLMSSALSPSVTHPDLVISIGGDGTLLQASHFLDDSVPIVGVNSDPTQIDEIEECINEFDATRSTGYLCAASAEKFEQVLDEILEDHKVPSELSRISISLNGRMLPTYALNDILVCHPCPANVSRFSFRVINDNQGASCLVNSRSSGLRICTASGSTAAMHSAGGLPMPILCRDFQYMVREPVMPKETEASKMHGLIKSNDSMQVSWYSKKGNIFIDGSHMFHSILYGDTIQVSSKAPVLKVHLPPNLLRR